MYSKAYIHLLNIIKYTNEELKIINNNPRKILMLKNKPSI